jgi:thiamine pyrophosphate-dependent acetolactate synthase large subunit-like protein
MKRNYHDGGEAIVEAFRNMGVDYIMSSPGSEWSPVWEAMARQTVEKNAGPQFIDCWHETVAVDMALGYTAYTGKPQAVLIHAGVGLMHGSMAMLSATQQEIPMLVMSGESTTFGEDPNVDVEPQWYGGVSVGGADRFVDPIVKWSTQITNHGTLYNTITRAHELAQRVPQGPVYLNVSLEAMLHEWKKPNDLKPVPPAPKTQPMTQDVAEVARLLKSAKNPTIVVETAGRDPAAMQALIKLAETFGAPVINGRASVYTNFPRNHPMWLGYQTFEHLKDSDLILLVSGRTPWNPPSKRFGTGKIVSIGENPIKMQFAYQVLNADLYLEGDVATAINALVEAAKDADKGVIEERRKRWTDVHNAYVAKLAEQAKAALATGKLDAVSVAATAAQVFPKDIIVCDETITHMPVMRPHLNLDQPQSFFRVTGGALGQGIAAALGTKLAARDRPVVLFVGDGSFLYNPIIQALGASKTYDIPITIVVCNNAKYEAMRKGHVIYYEGGVSDTTKFHYGVNIAGPEYQELGVHYGLKGFKAETPDELKKAFESALAENKAGRTAIINAVMVK